jgi:hypothetical protein
VSSLAIGGPLMWYLDAEFHTSQKTNQLGDAAVGIAGDEAPLHVDWSAQGNRGPVMGVLAVLSDAGNESTSKDVGQIPKGPWIVLGLALIAGLLVRFTPAILRQVMHRPVHRLSTE